MKTKMNIGISSLILIFIVLCLVTFGLLSLSSAKTDLALAERNGNAVKEYYRADKEAERFIAMADGKLKELEKNGKGKTIPEDRLQAVFKEFYHNKQKSVCTDIPMERGQALHVELDMKSDERRRSSCRIRSFYVYNQEDYEIDTSMPVWTGQ